MILGSVEYVDENTFGTGREWALHADGSFRGYRVSTRLVDRLLLGAGGRLSVQIEHAYRVRESFDTFDVIVTASGDIPIGPALRAGSELGVSLS